MHLQKLTTLIAIASTALGNTVTRPAKSVTSTCQILKAQYPNLTLISSDAAYVNETQVPWNRGSWLSPACIVTPSSASELSKLVQTLSLTRTQFAMRGGGHMFITSSNSIGPEGVLISSSKLRTLSLSADLQTLSVGPGPRWGEVYVYLASTGTGKMIVGGRLSPVGVPGLLLGGGISFFSSEFGFASSNGNIRAIECVLASGQVVLATATNSHSDLYWALLGGGNSFCLVTRFDLRTFDSPVQSLTEAQYGSGAEVKNNFLDATLTYAKSGSQDVKAAIIPVARLGHGATTPVYDSFLFYNGNVSKPEILKDFQGAKLTGNRTSLIPLGMGRFSQSVEPAFRPGGESYGLQQKFHVVSIKASKEAMVLVHDLFFEAMDKIKDIEDFFVGLAYLAITTSFTEASNTGVGCPQGLVNEPALWVEQALSWGKEEDNALVFKVLDEVNAKIDAVLAAKNLGSKYLYLNDAEESQKVFESYPRKNLIRLKAIRAKYDPARVYTDLMKGGFKVDAAKLS